MKRDSSVKISAGLVVLALAPSLVGAQQPSEQDRRFSDVVDVKIVNLDVYVNDKKGRPITGLRIEDFEVLEDRRPVEITNFLAVEELPSGEMTGSSDSEPEPLNLIFYLDNLLTSPVARSRILADVDSFLERPFPSQTTFMLVTHDQYLEVAVPHTDDAADIRRGIADLGKDASGVGGLIDRARALDSIRDVVDMCNRQVDSASGGLPDSVTALGVGRACDVCADVWGEMVNYARQYAVSAEERLVKATTELARLIAALGGLPGRKALLYLSGGMEQRPGYDVFLGLEEYCPDREREINTLHFEYNQTARLNQLVAHANANRVTFYPLDTEGVRSSKGTRSDQARVSNLQGSLSLLAMETGGEAIFNAHRPLSDLRDMTTDLTNYYSIAYRPIERVAAPAHLVDVRLRGAAGKNRRVRYRRTLRAKTEEERLAERLMATLILGSEQNPLGIRVSFGEQIPRSGQLIRLPVRIELPAGSIFRPAGGSTEPLRLRLFLTARDDRNRGTTLGEKTIELKPSDLADSDRVLSYVVNLDLDPAFYQVAIGVRDETAKTASYLRRDVVVATP